MERKRQPGPEEDGEEHGSSPFSFSGTGGAGWFAEGGAADVLVPGAALAGRLAAVTGDGGAALAAVSDREVLGWSRREPGWPRGPDGCS